MHRKLSKLPRSLSRNHQSLFGNGRRARFCQAHRIIAGLRSNLRDKRGFYAQNEQFSPAGLRRLRRDLRRLRQGMRKSGGRRGLYATLRGRLPQVRGQLPKDVFDVFNGFNVIRVKAVVGAAQHLFQMLVRQQPPVR